MMPFRQFIAAAGIIVAAAACDDGGIAPVPPGQPPAQAIGATFSLMTPNTNDGAVIVTLRGPDLSTIQAADSHYILYSRLANSQEARVMVIGNLAAGPILTVRFGGPQSLSAYSGSIQQVATRGDSILGSTEGYQLTVSAP